MMQSFSFLSGNSSQSESATEMHSLENRRQRRNRRQPDTTHSDIVEMEDTSVKSAGVASTGFIHLNSLSPLQKKHKMRSFERLVPEGFDENGYVSDSCLPSVRQSLAMSRQYEREISEGTPLLGSQQSIADLERVEQSLTGNNEDDDLVEYTSRGKKKRAIKKLGIQIKILILFAIMLASVVRHPVA